MPEPGTWGLTETTSNVVDLGGWPTSDTEAETPAKTICPCRMASVHLDIEHTYFPVDRRESDELSILRRLFLTMVYH